MRLPVSKFVLAAILISAVPAIATAQVTLRCGGGTVQTNGFIINSQGEVVFGENSIACNVQLNPGLPDPLNLSITAPAPGTTINVATQAQIVPFGAQITNYTAEIDTCNVQVLPPASGTPWAPVVLNPNGSGAAATNLQFAKGIPAGIYTLKLSCKRVSNDQEIIVQPVNRTLTVQSIAPPDECDANPIAPIFNPRIQKNFTDAYSDPDGNNGSGGFGVQPNVTTNWRYWRLDNTHQNGDLAAITLRTWKFRPTANTRVTVLKGNIGSSEIAVSISECPGQFTGLPASCRSGVGSVSWSTVGGDSPATKCVLDPTKDYYISAAQFNLTALLNNGVYQSSSSCVGSSCTTQELYQVQNLKTFP